MSKREKKKSERINYTTTELKKTWKKKINLKNNLCKIFSEDDNGEKGPSVYIASNYRDNVFIVMVEAYGYSRKFKKFQSNAQNMGVRMTKIGESHNGWQDFLLENQYSYALSDEFYIDKDYKAVEIDRCKEKLLPDSPEAKEIIQKFLKRGYAIEYISEDIKLMKWPTEIHFINEKHKDFQRYRLCIHDDGMGDEETDKAIEIGSKIVEKYGYHQGVKSNDSTNIHREENEDEWYKYL